MLTDFRERGREREKPQCERIINWLPPIHAPNKDGNQNPGKCPDQRSNPQHFGAWGDAPTN